MKAIKVTEKDRYHTLKRSVHVSLVSLLTKTYARKLYIDMKQNGVSKGRMEKR